MAFTIVFATPGFSAKVNERKVLVATMLDMLVQSLQSSSLICQFSRQLVTVGKLLFPVVEQEMPFLLQFSMFLHEQKEHIRS